MFFVRFLALMLSSLSACLLSAWFFGAMAAIPDPVLLSDIATCLPDLTKNQTELLSTYTADGQTFYLIEVLSISPGEDVEVPEGEYPMPRWELIVSRPGSECKALNTAQSGAATVPESTRRQLRLEDFKNQIQRLGLNDFKRQIGGAGDPHHGSDAPEMPSLAPDAAWALQQLKISVPSAPKK